MQTSNDFSSDISIDKGLRKLKMFSKDIELSITSDKADERERSSWNVVNVRQFELGRGKDWNEAILLNQL